MGMARAVRFGLSLGDAPPEVSRPVVPEWWYAMCGELWPDSVLSVHDEWDQRIDKTYETSAIDRWGRFDENILGWAWEGESPYAQLCYFYRTGNLEHWRRAIRDSYYIADIAFDHSTETIRMTDCPFDGLIAPALFRTVGLTFGYLETGDPYLLECSESVATHWYWIDRHNWLPYSDGRDGARIRSLIFFWDYTDKEDCLTMAREAIGRLVQMPESRRFLSRSGRQDRPSCARTGHQEALDDESCHRPHRRPPASSTRRSRTLACG